MREPAGLLPGSDDRPADAVVKTLLLMLQLSVIQAASVVPEGAGHCGECPLWEGEEVQGEVRQRGITLTPWQWKLLEAGTLLAWSITRLGRQLARNFCRKEPIAL